MMLNSAAYEKKLSCPTSEPEWRRRGLAALLIERIIDWAHAQGIDSLALHASADGRGVYERPGLIATTEMRFRSASQLPVRLAPRA